MTIRTDKNEDNTMHVDERANEIDPRKKDVLVRIPVADPSVPHVLRGATLTITTEWTGDKSARIRIAREVIRWIRRGVIYGDSKNLKSCRNLKNVQE